MVKAVVLEAQFGGMYSRETAQGELESRVGLSRYMVLLYLEDSLSEPPAVSRAQ